MKNGTREIMATTPQGLVVSVKPDGSWGVLRLAQNTLVDLTSGDNLTFLMEFTDVLPKLRSAFQTYGQFLVVTSNANLGSFKNAMGVGTKSQYWEFAADVGTGNAYNDYRNVLIFKSCKEALSELVKNPMHWTQPGDFNSDDLMAVSEWLQAYVADGIQQWTAHENRFFEKFYKIVQDPSWEGILALKVDIKKVPDGLTGLLDGLDEARFNAHHLGIEVTRVELKPKIHMSGNSSIFGLIYYMDPEYVRQLGSGKSKDDPVPPASGATYNFKVLNFRLCFNNTRVADFYSKAQVTMNKPFGDAVTGIQGVPNSFNTLMLTGNARAMMNKLFGDAVTGIEGAPTNFNTLVLTGVYQHSNGQDIYVFDGSA
jgi:hypothetical protein